MPPRGDDDARARGGGAPQFSPPRLTPAVRAMLVAIVVLFVVQLVEQQWRGKGWFGLWLALYPKLVLKSFQLWRLFTWPLVQAVDVSGVLWACVGLYFFGTDLEQSMGARRFLGFVLTAVVGTGLVTTLYGLLHPVYFTAPVHGVTPLGFALTAAWGARFPDKRVLFPPVAARVFVWLVLGLAVLSILARATHDSPAASLGAIGLGWLLGRYGERSAPRNAPGLGLLSAGRVEDHRGPVDKRFLN